LNRERVQKLLSRAGLASRREAEDWIRQGRVTVNGTPAVLGDRADPKVDSIKVDGRRVRLPDRYRYLVLNKPPGVVSTRKDPEDRPTVFDLLPERLRKGLKPVGRLDFHSEGLLLLTDDGDWAQRVAHPRYGCRKIYLVKVQGIPAEDRIDRLRGGIVLEGKRTGPCRIRPHRSTGGGRSATTNSWWEVQISEGRNRQIREMFHRIGHPVQRLKRVAIGGFREPDLPPGGWRELRESEVELLRGKSRRRKKPRG